MKEAHVVVLDHPAALGVSAWGFQRRLNASNAGVRRSQSPEMFSGQVFFYLASNCSQAVNPTLVSTKIGLR